MNIDWQNSDSYLVLNPRLSPLDKGQLQSLYAKFNLPKHIWICSSGSSARTSDSVKLIALSKSAILCAAQSVNEFLDVDKSDSWLLVLPTFHIGGIAILARSYLSQSKITLQTQWNPEQFIQLVKENQATLTALVPTQVFDLVKLNLKAPASLKAAIIGGGNLPEQIYFKARELGWPLLPSFGMTETCAMIAGASLQSLSKLEYPQLQLLPHCKVKIDLEKILSIASPSLLTGYAQLQNGNPLWDEPVLDGWLRTDDRVELSQSSGKIYLRPLGRKQDYFKIKGEGVNLSLINERLEKIILALNPQSLTQFTLIILDAPREQKQIYLVYEEQIPFAQAKLIQEEFNQNSLSYERITALQAINGLPRTALGKVEKSKLLELLPKP